MLKRRIINKMLFVAFIMIFTKDSIANNKVALSEKEQTKIIKNIVESVKIHSIYPKLSRKIQSELLENLKSYKYLGYEDTQSFSAKLTKDLLALSFDEHIIVQQKFITKTQISKAVDNTIDNTTKLLAGNVGLVVFDLNSTPKQIDEVFSKIEKADVLVIDLRDINTGKLDAVQYLSSYFFKQRTLLNTVYLTQSGNHKMYWTDEHQLSKSRPDLPIYLLVNANTSGVAEVLASTLQQLKNAYIVGENTAGNIRPRRTVSIGNTLDISIPYAKIYHADKEIVKIKPDLLVVSFLAFKETYPMAKHSAIEYRVKQGRGTPQEMYSLNSAEIVYDNWQFHKGQCLIKYRLAEPRYNQTTSKYQFPFQIQYYGNGKARVQYQLGNKTGKMTQRATFRSRDDIKSGISTGFLSHSRLSILACKILS